MVTETVKTVTETKDNVITKYLRSVSKHRIWLLILLLIASLGAAYAYIHYEHLRKKYLVDSVAQIEINDLIAKDIIRSENIIKDIKI